MVLAVTQFQQYVRRASKSMPRRARTTEYFRYRMNTFAARHGASRMQVRPLAPIRAFFLRVKSEHSDNSSLKRGIELVVPEVEYCCMEAVRAMVRGEELTALGMVN